MNQNGTVTTYAYDANNRLLGETVGDTVTAYTYDANGNTLTAGDKTYTYNTRGQQTGFADAAAAADAEPAALAPPAVAAALDPEDAAAAAEEARGTALPIPKPIAAVVPKNEPRYKFVLSFS